MTPRCLLAAPLPLLLPLLSTAGSQAAAHAQRQPTSRQGRQLDSTGLEARLAKIAAELQSEEQRTRWSGIHKAVGLGEPAVPMLAKLLVCNRRCVADAAAEALCQLGPRATGCLDQVLKMLKDEDIELRMRGFEVLAMVGPHDRDRIEIYQRTANERRCFTTRVNGRVRSTAYITAARSCLVHLAIRPDTPVEGLIAHLGSDSAAEALVALDYLRLHGRKVARRAARAVRGLLESPDLGGIRCDFGVDKRDCVTTIQRKAALLLMWLGESNLPATAHENLLGHPDPAVRQRAALALGALGQRVPLSAVQLLEDRISDDDALVAWDAITALGMIGPAASSAIPRLRQLAAGQDKPKAVRAQSALRSIERR